MKKSIVIILIALAFSISVNAQHTTPRFGTSSNSNKTFSGVTLGLQSLADTGGATTDTVLINSNQFCGNYIMTVTDSCVLAWQTIGNSYKGDNFTITLSNTSGSGHFVDFLGYSGLATKWGMASTGTKISLASGLTATLQFYFDGSTWNEVSRSIR